MMRTHSSLTRQDVVQLAIAATPMEESFHARRFLNLHPEFHGDSSILMDLAYEEYCQAVDRGSSIDEALFAAQFPEIEISLLRLLEVHSFILGSSQLSYVEPSIDWPSAGEHFLGFRLNEEIGRGAFSRVFLASEVNLGNRQVVVKISGRGEIEAAMLGVLDHPNIVPVYSMTTDEAARLSALCMPYLGRTTAADWIKTRFKKPSLQILKTTGHLETILEIGKGVCRGLQFAHDHDFLHCDVKPSNLLMTPEGDPILLDFNLSMDRTRDKDLAGGTLLYMAPEQLQYALGNESSLINESTDVFGLGATLYEMATGESPFHLRGESGTRLGHVIEAALEERRAFASRNHSLPDPFRALIHRALAFDQRDRFQSANEFFDALSTCQKTLSRSNRSWLRPAFLSGILAFGFVGGYAEFNQPSGANVIGIPRGPKPSDGGQPKEIINVKEIVGSAQNAESKGRYDEAIELYSRALSQQTLSDADRRFLDQSLLFCLFMTGQIDEAGQLLAERPNHQSWFTPRTLSLIQSSLHDQCDINDIDQGAFRLRKQMSGGIHSNLIYEIAVLHALVVSQSEGEIREGHSRRASQHRRSYLKFATFRGDEPVAMNRPKLH